MAPNNEQLIEIKPNIYKPPLEVPSEDKSIIKENENKYEMKIPSGFINDMPKTRNYYMRS